MSDKACWTEKEEEAFLLYLLDHKSEAGDGANFTNPVWQGVALHLQPLLQRGGAKVAKSCKSKWTNVCATCCESKYLLLTGTDAQNLLCDSGTEAGVWMDME